MPPPSKIALLLLTALAAGLRFPALFANHFHADEALFASWARLIAVWRDPLLLTQAVDKPPLLFYLAALFFPLFGPVEWAARWPDLAASILLVPLTAVLAWRLYGDAAAALLAAALVAAAPLAVQFSATVFTDPLLTFLLMAALFFVAGRERPFLAGLCFGLAALTKHQAWLFLPLLLGAAWLSGWPRGAWRRGLLGLLGPLALFAVWQLARGGGLDLAAAQWRNFGGVRPAWSWELLPRLRAWGGLWPTLFGPLLGALAVAALAWPWLRAPGGERGRLFDRLLALFLLGYLALHWLLAIPAWDRYLLPLLPPLALLLARFLVDLAGLVLRRLPRAGYGPGAAAALLLLTALLLPGALAAKDGRLPAGGFPGADQGAWQVRDYLYDAPYGTVLYDHWYSWHWAGAFFDRGVYTSWFPTPAALAADLSAFGGGPGARYLVTPADGTAEPALRAVGAAGYTARPVLRTGGAPGMTLYRLEGGGG